MDEVHFCDYIWPAMGKRAGSGSERFAAARAARRFLRELSGRNLGPVADNHINGEPLLDFVRRVSSLDSPTLELPRKDYDPAWHVWFAAERQQMASTLVGLRIVDVEHIGSTAVQSMSSNDIVDIALRVEGDPAEALERLRLLGYRCYGPSPFGPSIWWAWRTEESRAFAVHVGAADAPCFADARLFCEYLSAHPEERRRYTLAKRALFDKASGKFGYALRKQPLIFDIIDRAQRWRAAAGEQANVAVGRVRASEATQPVRKGHC
ncbi:GrpB family protein [Haliangium ochraceum]|nr:GrpB family protein [Haliangium ochraceum]